MDLFEDRDVADLASEEVNKGKTQKKIAVVERRRRLQAAARKLSEPNCSLREYMEAIREIEPREESPQFVAAMKLWYEYRGKL